MDIQLNTDLLIKNNLSVSEFLYIRNLYVDRLSKIDNLSLIIDPFKLDNLELKGFIKITKEGIILRQKSKDLFNHEDLFDRFLVTFPIKTPLKKRYLSPAKLEGVAYNTLKNKWNRIFKNDKAKAQKAIEVLEAEIRMRQKSHDGLEFMNAVDVWLNQANYEKYEYLLEEDLDADKDASNYNDWL